MILYSKEELEQGPWKIERMSIDEIENFKERYRVSRGSKLGRELNNRRRLLNEIKKAEELEDNIKWLAKHIEVDVGSLNNSSSRKEYTRKEKRGARFNSSPFHDCMFGHIYVGWISKDAINSEKVTLEHFNQRQESGYEIIRYYENNIQTGKKEWFFLAEPIFKACQVCKTTPTENERLKRENKKKYLRPTESYKRAKIELIKECEPQIPKHWKLFAQKYQKHGVKLCINPPVEGVIYTLDF